MNRLFLLLLALCVTLMAGGYDMKQDDKGRTVRINKITGEVSVIEGDKLVKLKDEKALQAEQEAKRKLGDAKVWPAVALPIAGGANAKLVTKWSDGVFYYQFFVDKNLRRSGN